jgi:hypothetical protein
MRHMIEKTRLQTCHPEMVLVDDVVVEWVF